MNEIIPSILEKDFLEIKNKIGLIRGKVKTVHLDLCDGIFVPNRTWPFYSSADMEEDFNFKKIISEEEGLPFWDEIDYEIDLMVVDAVENFYSYFKLGPRRIIFHLSAQKNIEQFQDFLFGLDPYLRDNIEIGLAFKPSDDLSVVLKLSEQVDFLQMMGSDRIGFQGEIFSEKNFERIEILKKELPGIILSVDIGINLQNASKLLSLGIDRLVAGSSIWKSVDPVASLSQLENINPVA
jgi:ribulose-phosphate 3-epimerase